MVVSFDFEHEVRQDHMGTDSRGIRYLLFINKRERGRNTDSHKSLSRHLLSDLKVPTSCSFHLLKYCHRLGEDQVFSKYRSLEDIPELRYVIGHSLPSVVWALLKALMFRNVDVVL